MSTNIISRIFLLLVLSTLASSQEFLEPSFPSNLDHGGINCNGKIAICVGPLMYKECTIDSKGIMYASGNAKRCPTNSRCVNDGVEICVPLKTSTDAPATVATFNISHPVAILSPTTDSPISTSTPILPLSSDSSTAPIETTSIVIENTNTRVERTISTVKTTAYAMETTIAPLETTNDPAVLTTIEPDLPLETTIATDEATAATTDSSILMEVTVQPTIFLEEVEPTFLPDIITSASTDYNINMQPTIVPADHFSPAGTTGPNHPTDLIEYNKTVDSPVYPTSIPVELSETEITYPPTVDTTTAAVETTIPPVDSIIISYDSSVSPLNPSLALEPVTPAPNIPYDSIIEEISTTSDPFFGQTNPILPLDSDSLMDTTTVQVDQTFAQDAYNTEASPTVAAEVTTPEQTIPVTTDQYALNKPNTQVNPGLPPEANEATDSPYVTTNTYPNEMEVVADINDSLTTQFVESSTNAEPSIPVNLNSAGTPSTLADNGAPGGLNTLVDTNDTADPTVQVNHNIAGNPNVSDTANSAPSNVNSPIDSNVTADPSGLANQNTIVNQGAAVSPNSNASVSSIVTTDNNASVDANTTENLSASVAEYSDLYNTNTPSNINAAVDSSTTGNPSEPADVNIVGIHNAVSGANSEPNDSNYTIAGSQTIPLTTIATPSNAAEDPTATSDPNMPADISDTADIPNASAGADSNTSANSSVTAGHSGSNASDNPSAWLGENSDSGNTNRPDKINALVDPSVTANPSEPVYNESVITNSGANDSNAPGKLNASADSSAVNPNADNQSVSLATNSEVSDSNTPANAPAGPTPTSDPSGSADQNNVNIPSGLSAANFNATTDSSVIVDHSGPADSNTSVAANSGSDNTSSLGILNAPIDSILAADTSGPINKTTTGIPGATIAANSESDDTNITTISNTLDPSGIVNQNTLGNESASATQNFEVNNSNAAIDTPVGSSAISKPSGLVDKNTASITNTSVSGISNVSPISSVTIDLSGSIDPNSANVPSTLVPANFDSGNTNRPDNINPLVDSNTAANPSQPADINIAGNHNAVVGTNYSNQSASVAINSEASDNNAPVNASVDSTATSHPGGSGSQNTIDITSTSIGANLSTPVSITADHYGPVDPSTADNSNASTSENSNINNTSSSGIGSSAGNASSIDTLNFGNLNLSDSFDATADSSGSVNQNIATNQSVTVTSDPSASASIAPGNLNPLVDSSSSAIKPVHGFMPEEEPEKSGTESAESVEHAKEKPVLIKNTSVEHKSKEEKDKKKKKDEEKKRKEEEKQKEEEEKKRKKKEEEKKKKEEKKQKEKNKEEEEEERKKKEKNESKEKSDEDEFKKQIEAKKDLIKKMIKDIKDDKCDEDDIYPDVRDCKKYYRCFKKSDKIKFVHLHCEGDKRFDFIERKCVKKSEAQCLIKE